MDTVVSDELLSLRKALFARVGHAPVDPLDDSHDGVAAAESTQDVDDESIAVFTQSPDEEPRVEVRFQRRRS